MSESFNLTTQTENSIEVPDTHSNEPLGIDMTVYEHVIDPSLILIPCVQQISAVFKEEVLSRFDSSPNASIHHPFVFQSVHM